MTKRSGADGLANEPRESIGSFPTPVEHAPALGDDIGVPDLYIKHDGKTAVSYGGNKVRKLEFLLGHAIESGCGRVLTSGGIGSNHVLATCVHASDLGLEPAAIQFPQPVTDHVRENLRALARYDPDLRLLSRELWLPPALVVARIRARFDDDQYYVPPGGSSPRGTLGFVAAGAELADQIAAGDCPEPDAVVVPASSGGTLAGLTVGLDQAGLDIEVLGVRVVEWYITNRVTVARLANRTAALCGLDGSYSHDDITFLDGYLGSGYAEPTGAGDHAMEIAGRHGLTLDPTYTAKTVAAISDTYGDETVLYWHTLSESRPAPLPTAEALERLPAEYGTFFD